MPDYKILLTRQAKDDIIDIGDYITYTLLEPETARKFVGGLRKTIVKLNEFPERYPLVVDVVLASQGIRCMPYKNHYIFYQIVNGLKTVVVLRVGHNRRNWKEILIQ
ncbi:type II toxin-antitoxin system RelE/ParE family toxin [Extibacter muris]|uniref:type II toxin-antitoxin system RelE/ParE family toxin n=1 Tax=Extibacter muris TaxID=1796622 RepID=UPI001D087BD2|nr:type II toxin-antitoxin system RelE/ParE family toxin [Extibacter muris]MCB6202021.1 type II toxin-antitoxin system RelE/ParE family toxin [Extibacter muris]